MINEKSFKDRGSFIELWKIRATELFEAAEAVWNTKVVRTLLGNGQVEIHELYRPAVLLMGLSLESLIKGLLIQNDSSLLDNGKISEKIKTHDLVILFGLANIKITQTNEIEFLKRLTANVIWVAKYAIPTKVLKTNPQDNNRLFVRRDDDFETFKKLFAQVDSGYEKTTA